MNASLTVLWPIVVAPDIEETRFSYDFCARLSEQLCKEANLEYSWVEYSGRSNLKEILPQIDGDMVLVVTDPEIILSPSAIRGLVKCLETGYSACGPVYKQTTFSLQIADLPVPYIDVGTYLEIAEALAEREISKYIAVDALDPACVLYRLAFLRQTRKRCLISEIVKSIPKTKKGVLAVATGALLHRGFKEDFKAERDDLVQLIPEGVKRVLDMGCAMGGYGKALKEARPEISLIGVELNQVMAQAADPFYDKIFRTSVEQADLSGNFDLVNCGDILEHLMDPWSILKRINSLLIPGGYLILSVPNVGHWSIVRDLIQGRFQYVPSGLLCVTHLRWFTESTIRNSLDNAGFSIEVFQREQISPTPSGRAFIRDICAAGYGDQRSLTTYKFVMRAVKK
ncbi:MAG: class I SAM-dependent methyltransferase [Deltaproteobacteria bacterium]|nr:class I SAM-dependent methyltransferase [Deltaproteobacteria bacterium]